jgi:fumarate reductase subunit C
MNPSYERYRPKPYHRKMSIFWWIKKKPYILFITRELTSLFVAAYAVILLVQLNTLKQGPEAWEALLASFSTPFFITLHIVILLFVLFHSITWFKLAPTAMVIKIGKKKVPGTFIVAGNFTMWILLSAGIAWILLQ